MDLIKAVEAGVTEANKVIGEVKEVVAEAKAEVKKTVQELSTDEKLALREIEVVFLKAQADFIRAQQVITETQKKYTAILDTITKKYVIAPAEWTWDAVKLEFNKL
jgi:hypothetical protein